MRRSTTDLLLTWWRTTSENRRASDGEILKKREGQMGWDGMGWGTKEDRIIEALSWVDECIVSFRPRKMVTEERSPHRLGWCSLSDRFKEVDRKIKNEWCRINMGAVVAANEKLKIVGNYLVLWLTLSRVDNTVRRTTVLYRTVRTW